MKHKQLKDNEAKIENSTRQHNQFLRELGLPEI